MPEYSVILTVQLRLTGEFILEARTLAEAQAAAQEMLDRNVIDMDYTVYESGVQSDDIYWDQEAFEVGISEVREILDDDESEESGHD